MKVIVSLDDKKLKRYLRNCSVSYDYVYLGERKEDVSQWLKERAWKEIKLDDLAPQLRDKLITLYNDLIGKLGLKYNSLHWWAIFTSAKNLVQSELLFNLSTFYLLANQLKENPERNVLVINPPKEICSSMAGYCFMNSIEFKLLSNPSDRLKNILKWIASIIGKVVFVYKTWKKIYVSRKYFTRQFFRQGEHKDKYYVLRSWIYDRSFDGNNGYHDAFFGVLPDYLVKKGRKLLIVGGIIGDYESIVKRMASNKEYLMAPQEYFMKYTDPIKVLAHTYPRRITIGEKIYCDGFDVTDIVRAEISKNYPSVITGYSHRYYIKGMLNLIDVDTFTTTYENNPWEKVCFYTLRNYSPETRIIGYQHVPLSQAHLVMFMCEREKEVVPMPDKINTIGKITRELLVKQGKYDAEKVKGSCALRFHIAPASEMVRRRRTNTLLVALRGILLSVELANFVYQGLKNDRRYRVVIRPHPVLPFEQFRNRLVFDTSSAPNFSISDAVSLKEDLQRADIVIYEGSGVAVEALAMGIPLISVDVGELVSWDSLFRCDSFRWVVDRAEDLQRTVEAVYSLSDDEYYRQQAKARQYLEDYVYEVTEERLSEFVL